MKKILTVIGARPQFVKASVVSNALAKSAALTEIIVHTGQHFDDNMSAIFFSELGIPSPKYNLGIGGGSHAANTGRAMEAIEEVIFLESPHFVLVYGDTDSTLAGALAASKLCVPVIHVEAGLRSFNRRMPEEINRVLTDHISEVLFAPSKLAVANLAQEGLTGEKIQLVGDVMFDAVRIFTEVAARQSRILEQLQLKPREYMLATLHRKENTDDPIRLASILAGLSNSRVPLILPLHPRTRNRISEFGLTLKGEIRIIDPVGYLDMMLLEKNATLIATDSGGVQKEAYFHGVPCITMREETEWEELIDSGANILVGASAEDIAHILRSEEHYLNRVPPNIYGDGDSADQIVKYLSKL